MSMNRVRLEFTGSQARLMRECTCVAVEDLHPGVGCALSGENQNMGTLLRQFCGEITNKRRYSPTDGF